MRYTSHRASLCTVAAVAAVAEALEARRLARFGVFVLAVLWAMLLTVPALLFCPERFAAAAATGPLSLALPGGFLFGLGAAINRGCAFSTLQRLADADWRMLATLAGFLAGDMPWQFWSPPASASLPAAAPATWLWPALIGVTVWALWELARLWRGRDSLRDERDGQAYSPAATAILLGLGADALYLGFGPWTYTASLHGFSGALIQDIPFPPVAQLALVPILFGGMLFSAWQRGTWQGRKSSRGWGLSLTGGTLMGIGGALIPGGNDTLLLRLIPALAPNSLYTYLMLILGVASGWLLQRRLRRADCEAPGCGGAPVA